MSGRKERAVPTKRNTRISEYKHESNKRTKKNQDRQKKQQRKIINEESVEKEGWERNASRRRKR